jgi:Protein of unknown function (DUF3048) C-terminal domain/Protein of unknown function (DUF3048) N-terminal domain
MRNRFLVAASVALLAASLVACGGGKKKEATTTTTTRKPATTTTTEAPVAPLSGVPEPDAAKRGRPAMIVKVDNVPAAFPLQEGVESADVVYVEEVENGATRMAVVLQSKDDTVGPVRSARTSDLDIAGNLNNPYFCYSGANGGVLRLVRSGPMIDMGVDRGEATRVYTRNQRGSGLHRFFLPTKEMYDVGRAGAGTPPSLFTYRAKGAVATGEAATGIALSYAGGSATTVGYTWDAATGGWQRTQNGAAHVMADTKDRIAPKNVVVQFTPYTASPFVDVTGSRSPEAELVGSGDAWVFTDGKLIRGRWSRPARDQVTSFTDAGGTPIGLTPGQTFVELVPAPGSFLGQGSVRVL